MAPKIQGEQQLDLDWHPGVRTIVALLQDDPLYYRHFGGYWWAIKRILKGRCGLSQTQLPHLGDADDRTDEIVALTEGMSDDQIMDAALLEQMNNATYRWHSKATYLPNIGPRYWLHDEDLGD